MCCVTSHVDMEIIKWQHILFSRALLPRGWLVAGYGRQAPTFACCACFCCVMGIQGLLPLLKSVTDNAHVRDYAGLNVGVDALCWLHKAVYGCAMALATGKPTSAHIRYCEERLDLLLAHGVRPYFVFDGAALPAKASTEAARRASRARARSEAEAAAASGDMAAAHSAYSRAVDVSPELAFGLLRVLRARGIPLVVAPYEADAQLAWMARSGVISAVLSEDSDMLAHAVPRTMFKMARDGAGQEVALARLATCEDVSFTGWSADMFLMMCVLAGCDYLPNLPGLGIRGAHELVRKTRSTDRLLALLRFEHAANMPVGFETALARARLTFLHQRVWDTRARRLTSITPLPLGVDEADSALDFLGPWLPPDIAAGIADGVLDPSTLKPYTGALAAEKPSRPLASAQPSPPSATAAAGLRRLPGQPPLRNQASLAALPPSTIATMKTPATAVAPSEPPLQRGAIFGAALGLDAAAFAPAPWHEDARVAGGVSADITTVPLHSATLTSQLPAAEATVAAAAASPNTGGAGSLSAAVDAELAALHEAEKRAAAVVAASSPVSASECDSIEDCGVTATAPNVASTSAGNEHADMPPWLLKLAFGGAWARRLQSLEETAAGGAAMAIARAASAPAVENVAYSSFTSAPTLPLPVFRQASAGSAPGSLAIFRSGVRRDSPTAVDTACTAGRAMQRQQVVSLSTPSSMTSLTATATGSSSSSHEITRFSSGHRVSSPFSPLAVDSHISPSPADACLLPLSPNSANDADTSALHATASLATTTSCKRPRSFADVTPSADFRTLAPAADEVTCDAGGCTVSSAAAAAAKGQEIVLPPPSPAAGRRPPGSLAQYMRSGDAAGHPPVLMLQRRPAMQRPLTTLAPPAATNSGTCASAQQRHSDSAHCGASFVSPTGALPLRLNGETLPLPLLSQPPLLPPTAIDFAASALKRSSGDKPNRSALTTLYDYSQARSAPATVATATASATKTSTAVFWQQSSVAGNGPRARVNAVSALCGDSLATARLEPWRATPKPGDG